MGVLVGLSGYRMVTGWRGMASRMLWWRIGVLLSVLRHATAFNPPNTAPMRKLHMPSHPPGHTPLAAPSSIIPRSVVISSPVSPTTTSTSTTHTALESVLVCRSAPLVRLLANRRHGEPDEQWDGPEASRRDVLQGAAATLLALGLLRSSKPAAATTTTTTIAAGATTVKDLSAGPGRVVVYKDGIEQSPSDPNRYRALTLPNGLRVLLVSDPESERAAAAIDVHVGHFSDPDDIPGLAHFCEHMLFLGTRNYPDETAYSNFLAAHGGGSNAYTDTEDTVYYFDVDAKHLYGALDRFSEFFKAPLFTPSATGREVNAIESENAKNLQSDGFRFYQLEKSRANPQHPFSKFGTGNQETLVSVPEAKGIDVRTALIEFHEKYYIAPRMTLSIVGSESLDQLQRWAEGLFAKVPTRPWSVPELEPWRGTPAFLPSAYGKEYRVVPVKDLRQLNLAWVVPYQDEANRRRWLLDKPEYYVSHLLGHEGEGSLLSYLKRKGLANGLGSGYSSESGDFSLFEVVVDLTPAGERDLSAVEQAVLSYVNLLKGGPSGNSGIGISDYVFDECRAVTEIQWRFQERSQPVNLASGVVKNMHDFDEARYLSGPRLLRSDNTKAAVQDFLSYLEPTRAIVTVLSKAFDKAPGNLRERWYGTQYQVSDVSSSLASYAKQSPLSDLRIHDPNPFIPTDLGLKATVQPRPAVGEPVTGPSLIRESPSWSVYHKLDRTFGKPKTYAIFQIANPLFGADARSVALSKLYKLALEDHLAEFAYPAALAGLSWEVDFTAKGMRLVFGGYSDKLPAFAAEVARRVHAFRPTDSGAFERHKDVIIREFANFDKAQPYTHAGYLAALSTEMPKYPVPEVKQEVQNLSLRDLQEFTPRVFDKGYGTALMQGNLLESEAMALADAMGAALPFNTVLAKGDRPKRRVGQLPITPSTRYGNLLRRQEFNADNTNAATELVFQIGSKDVKDKVSGELLTQLIEQPFYDRLRTQQQLGYLVFSGIRFAEEVPSIVLIVQSNVAGPQKLAERMMEFVDSIGELLQEIPETEFREFVKGLVTRKLEREKRLEQEASRHWEEISLGTFRYDRPVAEAKALKSLTKADVMSFYERYLQRSPVPSDFPSNDRRLLTVQLYPSVQSEGLKALVDVGGGVVDGVIDDELAFRGTLQTYA